MKRLRFLSGNMLKIIAAITMFIDHFAIIFFPDVQILRIIGRIAFPIFAFMIAEGCKYTKNKFKYFSGITIFGILFQVVFYIATKLEYYNIFLVFSLSIIMIYSLQAFRKRLYNTSYSILSAYISGIVFISTVIGTYILNQKFVIDYGFYGCMAPVFVSLFTSKEEETPRIIKTLDNNFIHVLMLGVVLYLEGQYFGGVQMYALLALPFLLLYSGKRGKKNMKNFFYLFYPIHLVVLYGVSFLLSTI